MQGQQLLPLVSGLQEQIGKNTGEWSSSGSREEELAVMGSFDSSRYCELSAEH